jgi:hypothetical protein
MATAKKNNYITAELDFAEEQLATWKTYVESHPFDTLADRLYYGGGFYRKSRKVLTGNYEELLSSFGRSK